MKKDSLAGVEHVAGSPNRFLAASGTHGSSPSAQVAAKLEEDIIFGRLLPGQRLIEDDLMERFAATRHVVRQALHLLSQMGIVSRQPYRGAVVRSFEPAEIDNIYSMRELLQGHAAETIRLPPTPATVRRLEEIHQQLSTAIKEKNLREIFYLNEAFHYTLFSECGNPYLLDSIQHFAWLSHAIRSYRLADPQLVQESHAEHRAILDAYIEGRREDLRLLCQSHIRPAKESYLRGDRIG